MTDIETTTLKGEFITYNSREEGAHHITHTHTHTHTHIPCEIMRGSTTISYEAEGTEGKLWPRAFIVVFGGRNG